MLKFKQLVTGQWIGATGALNFTLIGLTKEGEVYKYVNSVTAWVKYPTTAEDFAKSKHGGEVPF